MAYDKKLLAAARRELERERVARSEAFEERRREVYARQPRIRAIDRTVSKTAAAVLKAALNNGNDPTAAIEGLRQQNLALQDERADFPGGIGIPSDCLTDQPQGAQCGATG